jgi:hypothetical protein
MLSEAVKALIAMARLEDGDVAVKESTVGALIS